MKECCLQKVLLEVGKYIITVILDAIINSYKEARVLVDYLLTNKYLTGSFQVHLRLF